VVATCSSKRKGIVGIGVALYDTTMARVGINITITIYGATLRLRDE
jgi:hypothetical protein